MPELTIPKNYKDGDILFATDLDAICDAVETLLNGPNLDSTNIQTSITGALAFTGMIAWYGNATPPAGWLVCDGSAVSQKTYAALYNILGTTYGPNTGGNFTLPDFRRYAPMGVGGSQVSGPANTMGSSGGSETHTLITAELPSHNHDDSPGHYHGQNANFNGGGGTTQVPTSGGASTSTTLSAGVTTTTSTISVNSTGGGGAHNNVQPSLISNFIIKT